MARMLVVTNCFDGSGWAHAGKNLCLALSRAGVDVVLRPLRLNAHEGEVSSEIQALIDKEAGQIDGAILHCLPHMLVKDSRIPWTACYFASETSNFRRSGWADHLNLMDECWVINHQSRQAALDSGVTVPVRVVPHAFDTDALADYLPGGPKANPDPFPVPVPSSHFLFYYIGEAVARKNLASLLKAFHSEFSIEEPVELLLKVGMPGKSEAQTLDHVKALSDEVKKGLKMGPYKGEVVVTRRLTDEDILRLHHRCDVGVTASYGEAWALSNFTGMALGKPQVVPSSSGFLDWADKDCSYLVKTHEEPCYGATDSLPDLYSATESWWAVDELDLRKQMRKAFEDKGERLDKARRGIGRSRDFSFSIVGSTMKRILERALKGRPDDEQVGTLESA